MALPYTFANQTAPSMGWLDTSFTFVGMLGIIPCTATGTNSYALTPSSVAPTVVAYQDFMAFAFRVPNASTGNVTVNVASIGSIPVYLPTGTQAGSGTLASGDLIVIQYNSVIPSFVITAGPCVNVPSSGLQLNTYRVTSGTSINLAAIAPTASSNTQFQFTLLGGGNGGGGVSNTNGAHAGGGASGQWMSFVAQGLNGLTLTCAIGSGGSGGATGGGNGNAGTVTTLSYTSGGNTLSATTKTPANGGNGSNSGTVGTVSPGGILATNAATVTAGGSITLVQAINTFGGNLGHSGINGTSGGGGGGGGSPWGQGGNPVTGNSAGSAGLGYGAGGGGASSNGGQSAGGAGSNGFILIEWNG